MVGYLGHPTGLVSQGGWRDSCSCVGSIPSITENSVLFVEEQSFPQTTDDAFSTNSGLNLLGVAGPVCWAELLYNL